MRTELKNVYFYESDQLCDFVNKNHITKENIQTIVEVGRYCVLFYWEISE